jgi:hypothetical protein
VAVSDSAKSLPSINGIPKVLRKWAFSDAKLRPRNVLEARKRMPWDVEHLRPAIVWGIKRGYGGVDYAGDCADARGELIAEAGDRSGVRVAGARNIDMTLEEMVGTDAEMLVLQNHDAANQQGCADEKHQGHGHFGYDQKVAHTLRGTAGAASLL